MIISYVVDASMRRVRINVDFVEYRVNLINSVNLFTD